MHLRTLKRRLIDLGLKRKGKTEMDKSEIELLIRREIEDKQTTQVSSFYGKSTLRDGCSVSDDYSTITCAANFVKKLITLKLKVNKCHDPISVTASVDVPVLRISRSHTYTSDDIIKIPRFTASVPGFSVSAGLYVQVSLTPNGDKLKLTVKLLAGGQVGDEVVYPVKLLVIDGNLPINTKACGIFAWWYDMKRGTMVKGFILVLIILISAYYCCYNQF
nr:uncharacterized protein LOC131775651 [Pocillopora verrucosa]